jgi:hypothetical protein
MGFRPKPKTERNIRLYKAYKKKGSFTKRQRMYWAKKLKINERRIYQIINQMDRKSKAILGIDNA